MARRQGNAGLQTGTERERETSADDVAPWQVEGRVFFMTGEGVQEDPIMRVSPGGALQTGTSPRSGARSRNALRTEGAPPRATT